MAKQVKKIPFTEEDGVALVEKYETTTVLTLLQEVASYPNWKINWNELVSNSKTGISSAREYQMLWRHLAYGHPLDQDFYHDSPPLDDDSDTECEREAVPLVKEIATEEVEAHVKVMIASHEKSQLLRTSKVITAPMTINVPIRGSMEEQNVIFPVTVQRQIRPPPSSARAEKTTTTSSSNAPAEKKRKAWPDEDKSIHLSKD